VERGFRARGSVGEEERSHHKPGRRVRERARELEKQAPGGMSGGCREGGGRRPQPKEENVVVERRALGIHTLGRWLFPIALNHFNCLATHQVRVALSLCIFGCCIVLCSLWRLVLSVDS